MDGVWQEQLLRGRQLARAQEGSHHVPAQGQQRRHRRDCMGEHFLIRAQVCKTERTIFLQQAPTRVVPLSEGEVEGGVAPTSPRPRARAELQEGGGTMAEGGGLGPTGAVDLTEVVQRSVAVLVRCIGVGSVHEEETDALEVTVPAGVV